MIHVRPFEPADWNPLVALLHQSFNAPPSGWATFRGRVGDENLRVATEGGTIVGGYAAYDFGQYWLGRSVRLAGVAGVGVAPHARSRGVAKAMMTRALHDARSAGVPIVGLYPATQRVYRSVGFEQSGERVRYQAPLASLGSARQEVDVVPLDLESDGTIPALRARYRPAHGNLDRNHAIWERLCHPYEGKRYGWLIGEDGYVVVQQVGGAGLHYDVEVYDLAAPSAPTARTLLALLASHRSLAEQVRWLGAPADPLLALLPEPTWSVVGHQRWMLRLVDVAKALRERGWPEVAGELHLDVNDALLPENGGRMVVTVAGGEAEVRAGGRGDLRCDVSALGPLYSGLFSATVLRGFGWVEGEDAAIRTADRLFAAPVPWMREMY